jgi:hypothetical protein
MSEHGSRSGQDAQADVLDFGGRRRAGRWWTSRVLLVCLVVVTGLLVYVRAAGHQARSKPGAVPGPPPVRVISAGHRLLGVQAGWQLFARGPDDLLRIQLARGRVTWTYVPPLETASPAISFVIGAHEALIRPADLVPGYVVPDGGQARLLTGPLAGSGPLLPGPPGTQTAWVTAGSPTSPTLSLVTLRGHWPGPRIQFSPGGPELPATAVSDGRGDALVATASAAVYDAGPGWDRAVPGTIIAVGPASWLTLTCGAQYRQCRFQVIDTANGARRLLPGAAVDDPYSFGWPPDGVIAPDGSTAAVPESGLGGATTVHLINLRTGVTRDLKVRVSLPGAGGYQESMAWSPDSRWLFVATTSGKLIAVNARSDQAQPIPVRLPPVDQVALRA